MNSETDTVDVDMTEEQKDAIKLTNEYVKKVSKVLHQKVVVLLPDTSEDESVGTQIAYDCDPDDVLYAITDLLDMIFMRDDVDPNSVRQFKHYIDDICDDRFNRAVMENFALETIHDIIDSARDMYNGNGSETQGNSSCVEPLSDQQMMDMILESAMKSSNGNTKK